MSYRNPPPIPRYNPRGSGNSPGYANEPLRLQTGPGQGYQAQHHNGPGGGLASGPAPPLPDKMSPVSPASRSPRYKDTTDAHNRYKMLLILSSGEHGGIVVEHQTPNRKVLGLMLTSSTVLCP